MTGSQEDLRQLNDELIEAPNPYSERAHNQKNIVVQNAEVENGATHSSMKFQNTENSENLV